MPISSSGCSKENAMASLENIRMKRHEKLDKKANELAEDVNKLDLDSVDTVPDMMSSGVHPRISRRHSVDVINSSLYRAVGVSPRRGSNADHHTKAGDTATPPRRGSDENGTGNIESRRQSLTRRSSVDVMLGVGDAPHHRHLHPDVKRNQDSHSNNRGRSDTKLDVSPVRRMSLPALYLSNSGQLVKGKEEKSRKPSKKTARSLAQLRSDPDHCNYLLRRGSGDTDGATEGDLVEDEYEAIKNCRYIRRPSNTNEELSVEEIFS